MNVVIPIPTFGRGLWSCASECTGVKMSANGIWFTNKFVLPIANQCNVVTATAIVRLFTGSDRMRSCLTLYCPSAAEMRSVTYASVLIRIECRFANLGSDSCGTTQP